MSDTSTPLPAQVGEVVALPSGAQKYAAALLSLAVVLITALAAAAAGPWTASVILGIVVVTLQGFTTHLLPLIDGPWRAVLKVGIALILAGISALLPLLTGLPWTFANTLIVILAIVNAAAAQLGVAIRVTPADALLPGTQRATVAQVNGTL